VNLTDAIIDHVLKVEGGYVHDPNDPGGETKYGISKRSYPDLDIANLTRDEAAAIYERDYIRPVRKVVTNERMVYHVVDAAVNHGLRRALDWYADHPDESAFLANRIRFYTSLRTFDTFGRGWANRLASLLDALPPEKPVEPPQPAAPPVVLAPTLEDHRPLLARCVAALVGESGPVKVTHEKGEGRLVVTDA